MSDPTPSIRQRYMEQTRLAILHAVAECLEESSDFSVPDVAAKVGISTRTVFRHFPSKQDLLAAFAVWYEQEMLPFIPLTSVRDLPEIYARSVREFDKRPQLTRAIALSSVGREVLSSFHTLVMHQLQASVEADFPTDDADTRRRLVGALHYLDSIVAYVALHDDLGFNADEIASVIGWLMHLAISDTARSADTNVSAGEDRR